MEKTARRQYLLKWQLILGAVVCAFVAFCALPGSVIAANDETEVETKTVEYVDREWNIETNQVDTITTDEEGNPLTRECIVLTQDMLDDDGLETGWYVLNRNMNLGYGKEFKIKDGAIVNLILKDRRTLTANNYNNISVPNAMLTIYGQKEGTGTIKASAEKAKSRDDINAGIEVGANSILTIKGGNIIARGTDGGSGIGGNKKESSGTISILGGTVIADGSEKAAGIGGGKGRACGTVCIYDGKVVATGGKYGAGIGSGDESSSNNGTVCIVGGNVKTQGGEQGAGIGGGNETSGGSILIGGGKIEAIGGKYATGIGGGDDASAGSIEITDGDILATGGKEVAGIGGDEEEAGEDTEFITITGGDVVAKKGDKTKKVFKKDKGTDFDIGGSESSDYVEDGVVINGRARKSAYGGIDGVESSSTEVKGRIKGKIGPDDNTQVSYIDRTYDAETGQVVEEENVSTNCKSLNEDICGSGDGLTTGWYVLDGEVEHNNLQSIRIRNGADVHLILKDDCKLTATKKDAIQIYENSSLTIYSQSSGDKAGKIVVDGQSGHAGIGVEEGSALTIKGGTIDAKGTGGGAGIGGNKGKNAGTINIYGGKVNADANDNYGAGIGGGGAYKHGANGSCGDVTIFGGTVNATGGKFAAGIGSGGGINSGTDDQGTINIVGGNITATGGSKGAGIGGGNETSGGTVLIDGGNITATGGNYAAGIGAGDDTGAGYIEINGGTITATGGEEVSGIGGDSEKTENETGFIKINGGDITATKGEDEDGAKYDIGDENTVVEIAEEAVIEGDYPAQNGSSVKYIDREVDENGNIVETEKECANCLPLNRSRLKDGLGREGQETWYVLDEDININGKGDHDKTGFYIDVYGDVNLILKNGCTLEQDYWGVAKRGIQLQSGATLNIYREKQTYTYKDENGNTIKDENGNPIITYENKDEKGNSLDPIPEGELKIDGGEGSAAINVPVGTELNIKGGTYELEGTTGGAAIGGGEEQHAGDINIYGGKIDAEGGRCASAIGGGGNYIGDSLATMIITDAVLGVLGVVSGGLAPVAFKTFKSSSKLAKNAKKAYAKADLISQDLNVEIKDLRRIGVVKNRIKSAKNTIDYFDGQYKIKQEKIRKFKEDINALKPLQEDGFFEEDSFGIMRMKKDLKKLENDYEELLSNSNEAYAKAKRYLEDNKWAEKYLELGEAEIAQKLNVKKAQYLSAVEHANEIFAAMSAHSKTAQSALKANKVAITTSAVSVVSLLTASAVGGIYSENGHGGDGGKTTIYGGTVTVEEGTDANAVGGGYGTEKGQGWWGLGLFNDDANLEGDEGTLNVEGGNVSGDTEKVKGTDLPKRTITLEGVGKEVEVVSTNCEYGVDDVYTLDNGKLYFYMSDEDFDKLTEIIVKDEDGDYRRYARSSSDMRYYYFAGKVTIPVNITGVEGQDGTYNGLPQTGYTGTPANEQGYDGEYEITYYVCENAAPTPSTPSQSQPSELGEADWEKTTPKNSGAEEKGAAPVYAGYYKVVIAVPDSEGYEGYCELEFKVEKATLEIVEQPTLSGTYGTSAKDMELTAGVAKVGDMEVEGIWELTDDRGSDIPDVGTTEGYEVTFTPEDEDNYNPVITEIIPEVEKATPEISQPPILVGFNGYSVETLDITGGCVTLKDEEIEGRWEVTDSRTSDILELYTTESYEVTFVPEDERNYNSVKTMVVPHVYLVPTPSEPTLIFESEENKQKLLEKIKTVFSDPEVKAKLSDPEVREKVNAKLTVVKEKLSDLEIKEKIKDKILKSELIKAETKDEIEKKLSDLETRKKIRDKILTSAFVTNKEIEERLKEVVLDPDVRNKLRDDITNTELIEDEEVREKLLSFIEE